MVDNKGGSVFKYALQWEVVPKIRGNPNCPESFGKSESL
jgi:hypothetical protein